MMDLSTKPGYHDIPLLKIGFQLHPGLPLMEHQWEGESSDASDPTIVGEWKVCSWDIPVISDHRICAESWRLPSGQLIWKRSG